ncbi:MAG: thioredoxin family protein [Bacteroidota bacterium]
MAVTNITDEEFSQTINDGKVIVKYYASWCGICTQFAPKFKRLSDDPKYSDINFVEVMAEQNPKARIAAGVISLPYIATFENGIKVETVSSNQEAETVALLENLQRTLQED